MCCDPGAVLRHSGGIVAHVVAEVQSREGARLTPPARVVTARAPGPVPASRAR